jgi:DNA-binding MarR family transcriptional regulator
MDAADAPAIDTPAIDTPAIDTPAIDSLGFVDRAVEQAGRRVAGIDPEAMVLVMLLHRVTNVVVYDLESTVHRPAGWSWSAWRALFTLWISGPLEPSRLAELSGMSRQAVSSLAKTLETDGLVERRAAEHDARSILLSITAEGERRLTTVFHDHNRREAEWANTLDRDERAALTRLLGKLADAAHEPWVSHRY